MNEFIYSSSLAIYFEEKKRNSIRYDIKTLSQKKKKKHTISKESTIIYLCTLNKFCPRGKMLFNVPCY